VLKGIVHLSPETPDDLADDLSQRPLNEARRASVGEMSEQLLIWLRFRRALLSPSSARGPTYALLSIKTVRQELVLCNHAEEASLALQPLINDASALLAIRRPGFRKHVICDVVGFDGGYSLLNLLAPSKLRKPLWREMCATTGSAVTTATPASRRAYAAAANTSRAVMRANSAQAQGSKTVARRRLVFFESIDWNKAPD
jgi:hypothetical protein